MQPVAPNNPPLVSPPTVDFLPFFDNLFQWFADGYPSFFNFTKAFFGILVGISIPVSIILVIGIVYCVERLKAIRKKEDTIYDTKVEMAYENVNTQGAGDAMLSKRWDLVAKHIESGNPNDWKQAIIDADIILDEILTKLGYRGDTIGDKLKRANSAEFVTLQDAWEAHRARNDIAHKGSTFDLNQHEAKRIFQLYKKVFEEFYYF